MNLVLPYEKEWLKNKGIDSVQTIINEFGQFVVASRDFHGDRGDEDFLREFGDIEMDFPIFVVIGGQSAGKSTVLNRLLPIPALKISASRRPQT